MWDVSNIILLIYWNKIFILQALKGIPRQAYYIATKVGRYELDHENMFNFTAEKTRKSIEKSLKLLGVDYVDVIQVRWIRQCASRYQIDQFYYQLSVFFFRLLTLQAHDIEFAPSLDIILTQTLPELSRQVADGKATFIGITGYPVFVLKECVERSNINISCVLSYTRLTLIDDTLLEYVPFFKVRTISFASRIAMRITSKAKIHQLYELNTFRTCF